MSLINTRHLKVHPGQRTVLIDRRRFRVVVAGRRWGKTQVAKTELIIAAASKKKQLVWYVAPTYQMARQILWEDLKASIPREWIRANGINETRMSIILINQSRIELKGADNPDTLRGIGLNLVVLDEVQDMKKDTWTKVLRPTLSTTAGKAIFIGTPKAFNWLYDLYIEGQKGDTYHDKNGNLITNQWKSWQFPTSMSPFIPRSEILQARQDMDLKSYRQEYEASFETMAGRVYYGFDRRDHVGDYEFNPHLPIIVGMDFNIDPMSMVIFQEQKNGEIWIVNEIILQGSNTEEAADALASQYFRHMENTTIFPDPAGAGRNHDRGESSVQILRESGFNRIVFKRKHPLVQDRINAVNRLLRTADGQIRLKVNRKCRKFIEAMEQTIYKPGTKDVDKTMGVEHPADAFGYYADHQHPVRKYHSFGISV